MGIRKRIKTCNDPPRWKPFDTMPGYCYNLSENIVVNFSPGFFHSTQFGPKILITMTNTYKNSKSSSFWVTIEDCPHRLCKKKLRITDKELFDIYRWVALNKKTLLEYWENGSKLDFCDWEDTLIKL